MSNEFLWVEKYRPKKINDTILPQSLKDTFNAIVDIFSGRHLQIFTTGAESYVPQTLDTPITPSNLIVKQQTAFGSKPGIRLQNVDGSTLFIQRQGKAIQEFIFSDAVQAYTSSKISLLSSHLLKTPEEMAVRVATSTDEGDRLMLVNGDDGSIACYTLLRSQNVIAPSEWTTDGEFINIGVDVDDIYAFDESIVGNIVIECIQSNIGDDYVIKFAGHGDSHNDTRNPKHELWSDVISSGALEAYRRRQSRIDSATSKRPRSPEEGKEREVGDSPEEGEDAADAPEEGEVELDAVDVDEEDLGMGMDKASPLVFSSSVPLVADAHIRVESLGREQQDSLTSNVSLATGTVHDVHDVLGGGAGTVHDASQHLQKRTGGTPSAKGTYDGSSTPLVCPSDQKGGCPWGFGDHEQGHVLPSGSNTQGSGSLSTGSYKMPPTSASITQPTMPFAAAAGPSRSETSCG